MTRNGTAIALVIVLLAAGGAFAYRAHQGNKGMESAANSVGTTTKAQDKNALANQGSTPPGNAAAIGGDRTK